MESAEGRFYYGKVNRFFLGGSTLYIETATRKNAPVDGKKKSSGSLHLTGHLGDVMKESAQIALTVSRNFMRDINADNTFLETRQAFFLSLSNNNLLI